MYAATLMALVLLLVGIAQQRPWLIAAGLLLLGLAPEFRRTRGPVPTLDLREARKRGMA